MGINDVTGGDSAATLATNTNSLVGLFSPLGPVALCTMSPVSTSTDSWATTANQTTVASNNTRATENTRRAAGITGVKVVYDVNPAVESAVGPESGVWKAPSYTADGTHPAVAAYKAEAAAINPALLLA
jgi:lysophospholipase L1-like esterase